MIRYLALDTNSIACFFEGGFQLPPGSHLTPPEPLTVLKKLFEVLDKNRIHLIIPELVITECKKIKEEKKEELKKFYSSAINGLRITVISNKSLAEHAILIISKSMESARDADVRNIDEAWVLLEKILKHRNTSIIDFDEKALLLAYKRGLMGKKPHRMRFSSNKEPELNNKPIHDIQPDSIIVECIKSYIQNKRNFELFLCTSDSNFYESVDKNKLDSELEKELHIKASYLSISDFLSKTLRVKQPHAKKINIKQINTSPVIESGNATVGKIEEGQGNVNN